MGVSGEEERVELLWRTIPQLNDEIINRYLLECHETAKESIETNANNSGEDPAPPAIVPDNEDALFALMKENYNLRKAQRKVPFPLANAPRLTYIGGWRAFSEEECALFEEGMRTLGKKFNLIHADYVSGKAGDLWASQFLF